MGTMISPNAPPVKFLIRLTAHVIFRDRTGGITHELRPGDTIEATHDTGLYFVTGVGGIYHDEAERI